ncbi:MAG: hypothetical protein HXS41_09430 [Theionarchaea archaeon]|nr:hypothetical protein [Theionarchaea archaeon]
MSYIRLSPPDPGTGTCSERIGPWHFFLIPGGEYGCQVEIRIRSQGTLLDPLPENKYISCPGNTYKYSLMFIVARIIIG